MVIPITEQATSNSITAGRPMLGKLTMKNCLMIVVALSTFLSASALAHATLDHASPPLGSSLATAPSEVVLFFTDVLEPLFSTIEVRNENGALMSSGKAQVDPDHGTQLRVALKPLPAGTYKVIWRVISLDTHRTQGDFLFHVW